MAGFFVYRGRIRFTIHGMKIIDYKTVGASDATKLDAEVNSLIKLGYQPYGSPYLSDRPVEGIVGDFAMYQAMVLDEDTQKKLMSIPPKAEARIVDAPKGRVFDLE